MSRKWCGLILPFYEPPQCWAETRFLLTLHMKFWSSAWGFFSHIGGFELAQKPPEMTPHRTRTTPGNFCKLARSYIAFASICADRHAGAR